MREAELLGAKDEDDALYKILKMDYKTYRPKYTGPELAKYPDGSEDTVWGIRRSGAEYRRNVR